jgi:propionyl-CoA carboxylase alpha chain
MLTTVHRGQIGSPRVAGPGDVLLVLEAMKMEHAVTATTEGTVGQVLVTPGQRVDTGAVLVVVTASAAP